MKHNWKDLEKCHRGLIDVGTLHSHFPRDNWENQISQNWQFPGENRVRPHPTKDSRHNEKEKSVIDDFEW